MEALTVRSLRQAIEGRDGTTMASFYTDNAVLLIIDQNNPPSHPLEICGGDAIRAYCADVCGRPMTHRVDAAVAEGNRVLFNQICTYPDGKRVFSASTLELSLGKIARQVSIQAWDA